MSRPSRASLRTWLAVLVAGALVQRALELPWAVLVSVPRWEVRAAWQTPLVGFLVTGGLLGLLALGVAIGLARRIARPIQGLTRASGAMLRGEAPPGPATPIAELEQLRCALVAGAARVQAFAREKEQAAEALRRANEGLEAEVAQRTAALSRANAELEESNNRLERLNSEFQETNARLEAATVELQQELEERQRAEAHLRSVALFPEQNPYPILRVGPDGTLLYANPGARPLPAPAHRVPRAAGGRAAPPRPSPPGTRRSCKPCRPPSFLLT
ncbi:MAG: hypothetical protein ACE147_18005 [Candidatus Methylomirabilales bacterium]